MQQDPTVSPNPGPKKQPVFSLPTRIFLAVVLVAVVATGSFLLGRKSNENTLSSTDTEHLAELWHLADNYPAVTGWPVIMGPEEDNARLAAAFAADLSQQIYWTTSALEERTPRGGYQGYPEQPERFLTEDLFSIEDKKQRDSLYLASCAAWATAVQDAATRANDAANEGVRQLAIEFEDSARQLGGFCNQ